MAGEYYRWLARDVKPEEKRKMTREEKMKNWWHYHKWHLVIGAVVLFLMADLGLGILNDFRNRPDYSVAYVGSSYLPEDTVEQLEEALEQLGEDLNGRGGVQVAVNQYIIYPSQGTDPMAGTMSQMLIAEQVKLISDLENGTSYLFLMEDPEQFQKDYGILAGPDGEPDAQPLRYAWTDCPVLRELPLGSFVVENYDSTYAGVSQDALSGLYISRRAFEKKEDCAWYDQWEALWNRLVEGAGA